MSLQLSETDQLIQDFYDNNDTDNFYRKISGGDYVHIGIFEDKEEDLTVAKKRTVEYMASFLNINKEHKTIDLGSGYGGASRYLAKTFGCSIECLNISKKQNAQNVEWNRQSGLNHLINVTEGSFEEIPFDNSTFDIVWSQDAIFHSLSPQAVFSEVYRVLKFKGEFIFSTAMMSEDIDDISKKNVAEFFSDLHLESLSSYSKYDYLAKELGFSEIQFIDLSENVSINYYRLLKKMKRMQEEMNSLFSPEFTSKMEQRLKNWVEAGEKGFIKWGILHYIANKA